MHVANHLESDYILIKVSWTFTCFYLYFYSLGTRSQSILQRGGDDDRSESFAGSDEYKNLMESEARELFRSSQNSLFQEERMEVRVGTHQRRIEYADIEINQ